MPDYTKFRKVFDAMQGGASTGGKLPPIPSPKRVEPGSKKPFAAPPPPPTPLPSKTTPAKQAEYTLPENMPPTPEGMARLYRAHNTAPQANMPEWVRAGMQDSGAAEASGRWFTDDPKTLGFYLEDQGPTGKPFYIDVPRAEYENYRVKNYTPAPGDKVDPRSFSRDQQTEFFVPQAWANSMQPIR